MTKTLRGLGMFSNSQSLRHCEARRENYGSIRNVAGEPKQTKE
jgi:hypothetical protein